MVAPANNQKENFGSHKLSKVPHGGHSRSHADGYPFTFFRYFFSFQKKPVGSHLTQA